MNCSSLQSRILAAALAATNVECPSDVRTLH